MSKVTKDGKAVRDEDTFTVTCLAIPKHMETYPTDENILDLYRKLFMRKVFLI